MTEKIEIAEGGYVDAWRCLCGNAPHLDGFYPCTRAGEQVEPTVADWPEPLYVCDRCGRVISDEQGHQGEVVGQAAWGDQRRHVAQRIRIEEADGA